MPTPRIVVKFRCRRGDELIGEGILCLAADDAQVFKPGKVPHSRTRYSAHIPDQQSAELAMLPQPPTRQHA